MPLSLQAKWKPPFPRFAKSLKSGADCPDRTGDLMITNQAVSLKSLGFGCGKFPKHPFAVNNLPAWCKQFLRLGATLLIANEIRGLIMAAPILVAMYHTGGSLMQAWLLLCVAVSVVVPLWLAAKWRN